MFQRLLDGAPGLWMYPIEIKFANRFDAAVQASSPLSALDRLGLRLGLRPTVVHAPPEAEAPGEGIEDWLRTNQLDAMDETYLPKLERPFEARPREEPFYSAGRGYRFAEALHVFLDAVWQVYGDGGERPLLAFKTIEVEHERRYADALPEARFVHIVRDPLTQFASTKRTVLEREGFLFHYPVGDLVTTFVKRYAAHARASAEGVERDPARHVLVRYEDLLAAPADEVARVCARVGVEPPAEPEALTLLSGRHTTEFPDNPSKPGVATPTRVEPEMGRRFGYETVTTERERALVTACTGRWARRLGYDYEDRAPSAGERARLLRDWLRVEGWERELLRRQTGARSFVRRRLAVLETALGRPPTG